MSNYTAGGFLGEWAAQRRDRHRPSSALVIAGLYRSCARVRERWVLWATGVTVLFILFVFMVQPVVVEPLFNDYQPLPSGEVRDSILALAKEAEVPVDDVSWFNASKQTKRISANVSGLGGTARIALNDNLLHGTSLPEIRAVMGHEMGHYRLHHGIKLGDRLHAGARRRLLRRSTSRSGGSSGATASAWASATSPIPPGLPLAFAIFVGRDVPADAGDELDGAHGGAPGGRVRARRREGAARVRVGRDAARRRIASSSRARSRKSSSSTIPAAVPASSARCSGWPNIRRRTNASGRLRGRRAPVMPRAARAHGPDGVASEATLGRRRSERANPGRPSARARTAVNGSA